jgi:hypothetical protein
MLQMKIKPEPVYIEMGGYAQFLNFDILLENDGEEDLSFEKIVARFLNSKGELILRKFLDRNGMVPSLDLIGKTKFEKGSKMAIFNPFHTFDPGLDVRTIHYEFVFLDEHGIEKKLETFIQPVKYKVKTDLVLPLNGKLLVYDAHDYLAHHRRVDLSHPMLVMLGIQSNFVRYAIDFSFLDEQDQLFKADGKNEKDWHAWGAPVFAPGSGTVVFAQNEVPENTMGYPYAFDELPDADHRPELSMGNCVVIDHGNGEFSWLVHLRIGSVLVKAGDEVKQGQEMGKIGFSGDSGSFVHLHYNMTSGFNFKSVEGLPVRFSNFYKRCGDEEKLLDKGFVETGEVIRSNFKN